MEKGASVICVVREESDSHMTILSPFTMRPGKTYRAAGVILEKSGPMLAATELVSLLISPFDATDLDDLSVIRIDQPMIAVESMMEAVEAAMEEHGMQNPLKDKMLIGARSEHVHRMGKAPENTLKDPRDLQKYLIQKYIETAYSDGSYGIRIL